jgi:hypothetical protein
MEPSKIAWQRNKFYTFYARMKIRVGGNTVPVDIQQGDEFEFDGTVIKYAGSEFTSPQTRGAINMGWADLNKESSSPIKGKSSNRSIAKATSVNRDLNNVQRSSPAEIATNMLDEDTVMDVSDRRPQHSGTRVLNVASDNAQPRVMVSRNMEINDGIDDGQEGVRVGRVRTPASLKTDISTGSSKISELTNL